MSERIKNLDYRHYICITVLLGFLALSVFVYHDVFFRTVCAFRDVGTSFAYYFCILFSIKNNVIPTVVIKPDYNIPVALPETWAAITNKSAAYWTSMLSGTTYARYFNGIGSFIALICMILLILLPILLLLSKMFQRALGAQNNDYAKESRPLRIWNAVMRVTVEPAHVWFKSLVAFIKDAGRGVYWKIGLAIWIYNLNVVTIVVEMIAFLFYFFVAFDFANLYIQAYKLVADLTLGLFALPWYVWIPVLIPIFQGWRHKHGLRNQRRHEQLNKRVRDSLPISCLAVGSMGAGKTTLTVDLALSYESDFRQRAYLTML